jgi:hypothetical protein
MSQPDMFSIVKFWNNKNTFFSHTNILSDLDIRILVYIGTTDFVISKKKIIDFMDELGLFIEEKPICKWKKISVTLPSAPKSLATHLYPFRST